MSRQQIEKFFLMGGRAGIANDRFSMPIKRNVEWKNEILKLNILRTLEMMGKFTCVNSLSLLFLEIIHSFEWQRESFSSRQVANCNQIFVFSVGIDNFIQESNWLKEFFE